MNKLSMTDDGLWAITIPHIMLRWSKTKTQCYFMYMYYHHMFKSMNIEYDWKCEVYESAKKRQRQFIVFMVKKTGTAKSNKTKPKINSYTFCSMVVYPKDHYTLNPIKISVSINSYWYKYRLYQSFQVTLGPTDHAIQNIIMSLPSVTIQCIMSTFK